MSFYIVKGHQGDCAIYSQSTVAIRLGSQVQWGSPLQGIGYYSCLESPQHAALVAGCCFFDLFWDPMNDLTHMACGKPQELSVRTSCSPMFSEHPKKEPETTPLSALPSAVGLVFATLRGFEGRESHGLQLVEREPRPDVPGGTDRVYRESRVGDRGRDRWVATGWRSWTVERP